jgi:hypothetical protein
MQDQEAQTPREKDLWNLAQAYPDPDDVYSFLLLAERPRQTAPIVEPVVFTRGRTLIENRKYKDVLPDAADFFITQIKDACATDAAVVVTPEFSLYALPSEAEPLVFSQEGDIMSGSANIRAAVRQIREIAITQNKTIVLGSVCEKKHYSLVKKYF